MGLLMDYTCLLNATDELRSFVCFPAKVDLKCAFVKYEYNGKVNG
jgi:hypothetical protein